jgi:hypothetical protein
MKATISGMPFCEYRTIEAPDLPVVRIRFEQEQLRVVGAEGHIDRITLTSGADQRRDASVKVALLKAAPYQYLPLPFLGCFINSGAQRWDCEYGFLKESDRAHPDDVALIGKSLGLELSSPASRSDEIYAGDAAALERAQNLAEGQRGHTR